MRVAENQLHPLEIEDARSAAFKASELQRDVEDRIRTASGSLAEAERRYREALAKKILDLRTDENPPAWSVCGDVARGDSHVAKLKLERDIAEGILDAARQEAFRRGSDRRDVDTLLNWSMRRDLRTDSEPGSKDNVEAIGGRRAA
jgi:hypothetical protein